MKNFTDIFKKIGGLSKENEKILISSIKKVSFDSKTILQKEGQISDKIYIIEKGIVKLNQVKANTSIKLYEGSIYGVLENSNINIISKIGKIKIDERFHEKTYQKKLEKNQKEFSITTIKANIFLTTK